MKHPSKSIAYSSLLLVSLALLCVSICAETEIGKTPEKVYEGELIRYPGPWAFQLGRSGIILVNDRDLDDLTDPDKKIDMSTSYNKRVESLRDVCERAKQNAHRTLIIAFDQFFSQYRPGQQTPRKLTPDMDEYIEKMAKIAKFAQGYGLGMELSLLSPLELGTAYTQQTGESGKWMHYRKGLRDPKTGAYSVQLWQQKKWANNKGAILLKDAGVRVFAFRERRIGGSPYLIVNPDDIVEITDTTKVERWPDLASDRGDYRAERIRVYGEGMRDIGPLDRVLVVQHYKTPEMDYFSDKAYPFMQNIIDKYVDSGIKLNALYSDEMHIQQDWGYFDHHDNGEFAVRYVSDGFAKAFAKKYGERYEDFAKYMIYFTEGQEDYRNDMRAKQPMQHVFGPSPEDVRRTALFRSNYYRMLQDGVVDLFAKAKRRAEKRYGYMLHSVAHATWAESPTIDLWDGGQGHQMRSNYEYTSDFVWSETVHQSAAACSDYFKWGDFLTGNGNDHCESGWLDRNYTGIALASSTGIINEIPLSYAAHWGMPNELHRRRSSLVSAAGASGSPFFTIVQDAQHRDVDVLTLYPIDLVAVDEHFGSWMTQYAYANYITQSKLLEMGEVKDGAIEIAGRKFKTLTVAFEPFPSNKLLDVMKRLAESGGLVIWSGPPPVLSREGDNVLSRWQDLFGVDYNPGVNEGRIAVGKKVSFNRLRSLIEPQIIMTHFLVDHIYPVEPRKGTSSIASVQKQVVGTYKHTTNGGSLTFLGFRPRDDQAQSLGYDIHTWFDILTTLGAYPSSGKFEGVNDNTEYLSRTSNYLICRFPNGAVGLANHLKTVEEDWSGGFARDEERDKKYLENNPPPSEEIHLSNMKINGHEITYDGNRVVSYRTNDNGDLIAFAGHDCRGITIDGKQYVLSDKPLALISYAPVPENRKLDGGALYLVRIHGVGDVHLPIASLPNDVKCYTEGSTLGSKGAPVEHSYKNNVLTIKVTPASQGRWIFVVGK